MNEENIPESLLLEYFILAKGQVIPLKRMCSSCVVLPVPLALAPSVGIRLAQNQLVADTRTFWYKAIFFESVVCSF